MIRLEIVMNPDEIYQDCIRTKNYSLRGIVLHDAYQTIFADSDDDSQTFYYRDLTIYMDNGLLVVGVGSDDGNGMKWVLDLDEFEWGQLRTMFDRIRR